MIRLTEIVLDNFKNVEHGKVALTSWKPGDSFPAADVVGIYGQNGSGKTSVIRALNIVRLALGGQSVSDAARECITKGASTARVTVSAAIFADAATLTGTSTYTVELTDRRGAACITGEKLTFKRVSEGTSRVSRTLFEYRCDPSDEGVFELRPSGSWTSIFALDDRTRTSMYVAREMAMANGASFLFSQAFGRMLKSLSEDVASGEGFGSAKARKAVEDTATPLFEVSSRLAVFAMTDLTVISTRQQAESMMDRLHIATHEGERGMLAGQSFDVDIQGPTVLSGGQLDTLRKTLTGVNPVLGALVPGLRLGMEPMGNQMLASGDVGQSIELTSRRGDTVVPLRCESEGIKKLVSILVALVDVYTKPGACVAIDELDSGVFEFLLGELLQVLRDHGHGQLIFTAHNLRPLEVLDSSSLIFTTTNPKNRYVKFRGSRETNNLRDQYLRAVNLGGQPETVYEPTSTFAIDSAFYEAGHPDQGASQAEEA